MRKLRSLKVSGSVDLPPLGALTGPRPRPLCPVLTPDCRAAVVWKRRGSWEKSAHHLWNAEKDILGEDSLQVNCQLPWDSTCCCRDLEWQLKYPQTQFPPLAHNGVRGLL